MILDNKLSQQEIIILDGAIGSEIARLVGVMANELPDAKDARR